MARPPSSLHLDLDEVPYKYVEIHPVVLFSILDNYIRRNENQERVVGTLLGVLQGDGVVKVTNCYTVPHTEKEQLTFNLEFHRNMMALHSTVAPYEQIVGWYSTSFNNNSVLLHNFYAKEINGYPIHLLLDPSSLVNGELAINCYYSVTVHFGDRQKIQHQRKQPEEKRLQEHFRPLRHTIKSAQGEHTALERMIADKAKSKPPVLSDLDSLERSLQGLIDMITIVSEYVKSVVKGKQPGDVKIGRLIEETIALIPSYEPGIFEGLFTKGLQDVLMIVYLANLTRTHLLLAEQLRDHTTSTTPSPTTTTKLSDDNSVVNTILNYEKK